MNPSKHVLTLLRKAAQDQAVLEKLAGDQSFDHETVGFHAQQAAEKLLKAWLSHLGVNYPKTHQLVALLDLLEAQGKSLPGEFSNLTQLTPFATGFRYDELDSSEVVDRGSWISLLRSLSAFVKSQIGGPTS